MLFNNILIVDDDDSFLNIYKKIFTRKKYNVITTNSANQAIEMVKNNDFDILITDMYMPELTGIDLIKKVKQLAPNIEIILVTGNGSIENAVKAIKEGAYTYIEKPIDFEELFSNISKIQEYKKIKNNFHDDKDDFDEFFIGNDPKMVEIKKQIQLIATSDSSVLITGESGTGKELVAKAIHLQSNRKIGNLVNVNCSAFSEGILESELFGHEKGSFTGASATKVGRFEMADNGTLFLDEIGEISQSIQVKLLRVLQEKEFERVGGNKTIKTNFRLVCATNRNLADEIEKGKFRQDLYYRLDVIPLRVPSLRERKSDIPILVEYFSNILTKDLNKKEISFTSEAIITLTEYNWPGNIRELKNIIERIIVLSKDSNIGVKDIKKYILIEKDNDKKNENSDIKAYREAKQEFEIEYIKQALKNNGWNITKTAEFMGIARKNLQAKIKVLNINAHIKD
jgi:DNA-binding NtrC family response regulator